MVCSSNQYKPIQRGSHHDEKLHEGFLVPYKICDSRKQRRNERHYQKRQPVTKLIMAVFLTSYPAK